MDLYSQSVPVFCRYLKQFQHIINTAADYAVLPSGSPSEYDLIHYQLHEGMLPAGQQANVAASFANRAFCLLQGKALPESSYEIDSFAVIERNIVKAINALQSLKPEQMVSADTILTVTAGEASHQISASDYLTQLCLPNFFFHISLCYALFKQQGVPLGKADFDGFHQYASGTRFV